MVMLPLGHSFAHWPQPIHASLALSLRPFSLDSSGHAALSTALTLIFGGCFLRLKDSASIAICIAFSSERFCAFSGEIGGIIRVCGKSQMQEHWWETPAQ